MEKALPPIPAKRYFTIGEVSELCGVKPYVLRYWEQEFTQLKPMKRRGNRRYYQHHEVLLIRRIRDLLYDQGFTISGARNRLIDMGQGARGAAGGNGAAELPATHRDVSDESDDMDTAAPSDGGGPGRDTLNGGPGADILTGGEDEDELNGGDGPDEEDRLVETVDGDFLLTNGSLQITTLTRTTVDLVTGIERAVLTGGASKNRLDASAFAGAVDLSGGDKNDTLIAGSGGGTLRGDDGDDMLVGGIGSDDVSGGDGTDTYMLRRDGELNLDQRSLTKTYIIPPNSNEVDELDLTVEKVHLIGGEGSDRFDAGLFTRGRVILEGNGGDDVLTGGAGNDELIGGAGNDTLQGGAGSDIYRFDLNQPLDRDILVEAQDGSHDVIELLGWTESDQLVRLDQPGVDQVVRPGVLTIRLSGFEAADEVIYLTPPPPAPVPAAALAQAPALNAAVKLPGSDVLEGGAVFRTPVSPPWRARAPLVDWVDVNQWEAPGGIFQGGPWNARLPIDPSPSPRAHVRFHLRGAGRGQGEVVSELSHAHGGLSVRRDGLESRWLHDFANGGDPLIEQAWNKWNGPQHGAFNRAPGKPGRRV